jgi:hypothetical protein
MRRSLAAALGVAAFAVAGAAAAQTVPENVDPSTVAIVPVSDPDPAGGPPWGLRTFNTTDGARCQQIGRLQDGKLGYVDASGNFVESPVQATGCGGAPPPGRQGGSYGMARHETPGGVRSVYYGRWGPLLKRVTFANPDGSNLRDIQVSPNGEYVAAYPGSVTFGTEPRQRLYFDGGCGPERRDLLGIHTMAEVVNCQVVIPLDEPRPQPESAASKRARRNPSRPSPVRAHPRVAGPGRRINAQFKVPITLQPRDAYGWRLSGEGADRCAKKLRGRMTGYGGLSFRTMVRGRWDDLLLPLGGKSGRWCAGTYKVEVFFKSGRKTYKPFGSATFRIK